jgi:6-phosphogluconolactonase (cycloisomerase 2 family)
MYSVNASNGSLTSISGSPVVTGAVPNYVAVTPSGTFAYVSNSGSNSVSAYAINNATGALTAIAGSPFVAGTTPGGLLVDPSGRFLFVNTQGTVNSPPSVWVFAINTTTGALTPVPGSPFTLQAGFSGGRPTLAIDPTGRFLYASSQAGISAFTIDPLTGILTALGSSSAGGNFYSILTTLDGKFLYLAVSDNDALVRYPINPVTGALGLLSFVASVPQASWPSSLGMDLTDSFLYVVNNFTGTVSAFDVRTTPSTDVPGSPFFAGPSVTVTVDPSGQFVYVVGAGGNNVRVYTLAQVTGVLTDGGTFSTGQTPISITVIGTIQ